MYDETNTPPAGEPARAADQAAGFTPVNSGEGIPGTGANNAGGATTPGGVPGAGSNFSGAPPAPPTPTPASLPPAEPPVPALAGLLGLIPGVGAMYNGQFAKGLAHLAIFAVLVSLADHVNGIFGIFVAGWIFYQAFEAYHTARARRDGLPLPNAFGLNDVGERLGFGKNWTGASTGSSEPFPGARAWTGTGYAAPHRPAGSPVPPPAYPGAFYTKPPAANWAGYVPPTAFATANPVPVSEPAVAEPTGAAPATPASVSPESGWSSVPYASTVNAAASPAFVNLSSPGGTSAPIPGGFPVGAVLLILLGGVFLLSNVAPAWQFGERWLLPLLLLAAAIWVFVRRLGPSARDPLAATGEARTQQFICALRLPVLLLVLAAMFSLQTAGWMTLAQTWPLLLISFGGLLLLERTVGRVSLNSNSQSSAVPLETTRDTARREAL